MSDDRRSSDGGAKAFDLVGAVIGLLVFLVGIAMIIMVFTWVRGVFENVDNQVEQAREARAEMAAAEAEAAEVAEDADEEVVVVAPQAGPTIADVGITIGLKMLGLLVLGWLGALVASRGAQLAAAHRGKWE